MLNNNLENHFTNKSSSKELLSQLVDIDSQVGNQLGILEAQKKIKEELEKLGFEIELCENTIKKTAPLILARRFYSSLAPTINLIGHSDVVTHPTKNPFSIKGDKIYGSGVADDKGGVVVCIKAIEQFLMTTSEPQININVVVSPNEETGSIGFHQLFKNLGKTSDYTLGLEPALSCGSLITSRSGNRWYQLQVKGIAAHAGRFGQNHINSAHKMSLLISQMHFLNDESQLRRVNVGSFEGGNGGFNTICDKAQAKIDVRFSTFECRDYLHNEINKILTRTSVRCPYSGKKSKAFYSIEDDCPPMNSKNDDIKWSDSILNSISNQEKRSIKGIHAGGAADINYFSFFNKKLIDGLGPVGGGLHTNQEYIEKDSLYTRTNALALFLQEVNFNKVKTRRLS